LNEATLKKAAKEAFWALVVFIVLSYAWKYSALVHPAELEFLGRLGFDAETVDADFLHNFRGKILIPLSVLSGLLFRGLLRELEVDPAAIDLTSTAWLLGSFALLSTQIASGHQLATLGVIPAFWATMVSARVIGMRAPNPLKLFLGGIATGLSLSFAVFMAWEAFIAFVLCGLYIHSTPLVRTRFMLAFVVGALPAAYLLMGQADWSLGEPPAIGLSLITCAAILPAIYGAIVLFNRSSYRLGLLVVALIVVVFLVEPLAFIPVLPLLFVGAAIGADAGLHLALVQGALKGWLIGGILYHNVVNAVLGQAPEGNPLRGLIQELLNEGLVAPNLVSSYSELEGPATLIPLGIILLVLCLALIYSGSAWAHRVHPSFVWPIAAFFLAIFLGAATQFGGKLTPERQKTLVRTIGIWNKQESSLASEARRTARQLQEMGR
jgi:hypothetical protein